MPTPSPPSEDPPGAVLPLSFGRKFRVWRYAISHSELKLRSAGPASASDLIEATFYGVISLKLRTVYDPLTIAVAEPWQADELLRLANVKESRAARVRCLALRSEGDDGLVSCLSYSIWSHPRDPSYDASGVPATGSTLILRG
jgi:hypothetical protein